MLQKNEELFNDQNVIKDLDEHNSLSQKITLLYAAPGFATTSLSFLIAVYANDFYGTMIYVKFMT